MQVTLRLAPSGTGGPGIAASGCRVRQILERAGDKCSLFVIGCLGDGPKRFTALKHSVDGISQRMLTVTLRGLERDRIVSRTMYPCDAAAGRLRAHPPWAGPCSTRPEPSCPGPTPT
jgi:HxlR-like helix-turn-helix